MSENKVSDYWLLPTVTLGGERNKHIDWGATLPTPKGDYIYTSFTPLGFLLPHLWFEAFDLQPTIKNLAHFNFFIHFATTILLYFLIVDLLKYSGINPSSAQFSALGGVLISIFSREALVSQGIIYWSQSLYQIVLVACVYLFFKFITHKGKAPSYISISLVVLTFLGAYLEWTGFIFAMSLAIVLWVARTDNSVQNKRIAVYIVLFSFFAGILIVAHYSLALGLYPTIEALLQRFISRSAVEDGNLIRLLFWYVVSYNIFLLLIVGFLASLILNRLHLNRDSKYYLYLVFIVACCPLLENFVMLQHASQFSFDRLRFIVPAAILIAFGLAYAESKIKVIFFAALIFSCVISYQLYKYELDLYSSYWSGIDASNRALVADISKHTNMDCAVFAANIPIRGYANMLLHRGIYSSKKPEDMARLIKTTSACSGVFLKGHAFDSGIRLIRFNDLPEFSEAIIEYPDGSIKSISASK